VKAIFSRFFRDDLVREEARYHEISERLAGAFANASPGTPAKSSAGAAGIMSDRMDFRAAERSHFRSTSITR
jgi:hypothetical protein